MHAFKVIFCSWLVAYAFCLRWQFGLVGSENGTESSTQATQLYSGGAFTNLRISHMPTFQHLVGDVRQLRNMPSMNDTSEGHSVSQAIEQTANETEIAIPQLHNHSTSLVQSESGMLSAGFVSRQFPAQRSSSNFDMSLQRKSRWTKLGKKSKPLALRVVIVGDKLPDEKAAFVDALGEKLSQKLELFKKEASDTFDVQLIALGWGGKWQVQARLRNKLTKLVGAGKFVLCDDSSKGTHEDYRPIGIGELYERDERKKRFLWADVNDKGFSSKRRKVVYLVMGVKEGNQREQMMHVLKHRFQETYVRIIVVEALTSWCSELSNLKPISTSMLDVVPASAEAPQVVKKIIEFVYTEDPY